MKLLIKKISDILDDKLTLYQRGILITALLSKDDNPKITLAKFKVNVKYNEVKEDLIYLHERGFIIWSGYKLAKKSLLKKELIEDILILFNVSIFVCPDCKSDDMQESSKGEV